MGQPAQFIPEPHDGHYCDRDGVIQTAEVKALDAERKTAAEAAEAKEKKSD